MTLKQEFKVSSSEGLISILKQNKKKIIPKGWKHHQYEVRKWDLIQMIKFLEINYNRYFKHHIAGGDSNREEVLICLQ